LAAAVFADEYGWTLLLPPPHGQESESLAGHVPRLASNLWHFPTIPVERNPAAELRSHLRKHFASSQNGDLHLHATGKVRHTATYRSITVEPFRIKFKDLPRIEGARYVPLQEITVLPVSNLTRKVARAALDAASPAGQKC